MTLPLEVIAEEVRLRQERINTLRLLFDSVSDIERAWIIREATGLCVITALDLKIVSDTLSHDCGVARDLCHEMTRERGAYPMGAIAGENIRSKVANILHDMYNVLGIIQRAR